jgi:putative membrane protein
VFRAALPGVLVSLVAALAVSLILLPLLHLSVGRWFFLAAATALAAVTFALLNQTMVALAHRVGRFGSTAVLVLAVVTSLTSTIPPTLHTIGGFLPTHAAVLALRGIITGSATAATGIGHLAVWLLVSALATVAVTEHRRTLSGRQLRLVRRPRLT